MDDDIEKINQQLINSHKLSIELSINLHNTIVNISKIDNSLLSQKTKHEWIQLLANNLNSIATLVRHTDLVQKHIDIIEQANEKKKTVKLTLIDGQKEKDFFFQQPNQK